MTEGCESTWIRWLLKNPATQVGDFCSACDLSLPEGLKALQRLGKAGFPLVLPPADGLNKANTYNRASILQVNARDTLNVDVLKAHMQRVLAVKAPGFQHEPLNHSRAPLYESIDCMPWVDSTQLWARSDVQRAPFSAYFQPRAFLTEYQSHGRGRLNRVWQAAYGDCLMMTVAVSVPREVLDQRFSLALGVLLCEWLNLQYRLPVRVKWPNDVLFDEKKLAGILIQSFTVADTLSSPTSDLCGLGSGNDAYPKGVTVLIGLGINVRTPRAVTPTESSQEFVSVPDGFRRPPIGLCDTGYTFPSKSELAAEILVVFLQLLDAVACREWGFLHKKWTSYDQYAGQYIRLESEGRESVEGLNCGIDASGHLILKTPLGTQTFCVGEVSLRPSHSVKDPRDF